MTLQKMPPATTLVNKRPLRNATKLQLVAQLEKAFALQDGLSGAHCIHELWMRHEFPTTIETWLNRLWQSCQTSIPEWLPMRYVDFLPVLYEITGQFISQTKGRSNIYLILLDYSDRREQFGVYVGMSRYPPAQRFDQHKAGIRAAGSVLKRGIEVLIGPTLHLQKIMRAEAARIEVELAQALNAAGLKSARWTLANTDAAIRYQQLTKRSR